MDLNTILFKDIDEPGLNTRAVYERRGGYEMLRKALSMEPCPRSARSTSLVDAVRPEAVSSPALVAGPGAPPSPRPATSDAATAPGGAGGCSCQYVVATLRYLSCLSGSGSRPARTSSTS